MKAPEYATMAKFGFKPALDHAPASILLSKRSGRYFAPSTSFAMVASCIFDVPS
jgi:hypothetical protein